MFETTYEELDWFLNDFEDPSVLDYWYDLAFEDAMDIIGQFTEDDWRRLFENLPQKPDWWKERLVYCLDKENDPHHFRVLEETLHTDDDALFVRTAESLSVDFKDMPLHCDEKITKKVNDMLSMAKPKSVVWDVLSDFKRKFMRQAQDDGHRE